MTRSKPSDHPDHAKNRQAIEKLPVAARIAFIESPMLSDRDSRHVQAILKNPPSANARLRAAAVALR